MYVLEAGNIGMCKDLSVFDNSQIVMARQPDQTSPKQQVF